MADAIIDDRCLDAQFGFVNESLHAFKCAITFIHGNALRYQCCIRSKGIRLRVNRPKLECQLAGLWQGRTGGDIPSDDSTLPYLTWPELEARLTQLNPRLMLSGWFTGENGQELYWLNIA